MCFPSFPVFLHSRNSWCLHCGAALLQQSGRGREHSHAPAHEHLPLQEGNWDLQLQLPQRRPQRQAEPTGERLQIFKHPGLADVSPMYSRDVRSSGSEERVLGLDLSECVEVRVSPWSAILVFCV